MEIVVTVGLENVLEEVGPGLDFTRSLDELVLLLGGFGEG